MKDDYYYHYYVEYRYFSDGEYHWRIKRYYETVGACRRFVKWLVRKGYYKPEELRIGKMWIDGWHAKYSLL